MKYLTAAQMREADRRCIQELGIPGAVLMNNAGAAVFREIDRGPIGIVCGKGNNGGDGYVVARLSLLAGFETRVVSLSDLASITGDASVFLNAYTRLGGRVDVAGNEDSARIALSRFAHCAVMVDAILGTGVSGEVRGPARAAIETWPRIQTIAIDLPSGLDADTGNICGACISANITVTFQFPKTGFLNTKAIPYLGKLVVADIGMPEVCADDNAWERLRQGGGQNGLT